MDSNPTNSKFATGSSVTVNDNAVVINRKKLFSSFSVASEMMTTENFFKIQFNFENPIYS